MAKLKAPLMSFGASGALAKSVVYFPWKGVNAVREYKVPANPRSGAQTAQRGHLEDAVDEWHAATYTDGDRTAWNRFAGTIAEIMSGFNAYVRTFIKEAILGNTWERITNARPDPILADSFRVLAEKTAGGNAPNLRWGTSKTHFPNTIVMTGAGGDVWEGAPADLAANTLYYWYIDVGSSGTDYGRTGIYATRTLAA